MHFSPLIVGTMRWSSWGAGHSERQIQNLVESCQELGLFSFDSADIYGGYTWEACFGNALSGMGLVRESYQLISKGGIKLPGGARPHEIKSYDLSKAYLLNCVDQSLMDLKTDYLDLYLLHRPSPLMDPEAIAAAFSLLRSSGKVLNFGVSNFSVQEFELIHQYFPQLSTNQIELSLTEPKSLMDGRVLQQQALGLQPTAWSPLGSYFSLEDEKQSRIKPELSRLGKKYDASEAAVLVSFLLKHPSRIVPVVGSSKSESIQKMARALAFELTTQEWFSLLELSRGYPVA